MSEPETIHLRELAEPLAALSIAHLTPATRQKLINNDLSVSAYPTAFGGFVYVGSPRYEIPAKPDLARVFELAERSGIVWLKFDAESAIVEGLQVFELPGDFL